MAKKRPPSSQGKVEPPNPNSTKKSKKRRRTTAKGTAPAYSGKDEKFYYCEGLHPGDRDYCNILLQKRLIRHSSDSPTNQTAPFEYRTGTNVSGDIFKVCNGAIRSDQSNLLVGKLDSRESQMWSSYVGAAYAARGFAPCNIARKLGTITRRIFLSSAKIPIDAPYHPMHQQMTKTMDKSTSSKPTAPSLNKIYKELDNSLPIIPNETEVDRLNRLSLHAKELVRSWAETAKSVGKILPNWNQHGEIPIVPVVAANSSVNDENASDNIDSSQTSHSIQTASVVLIRTMLESNQWHDDAEFCPREKDLYHLKIPTDTLSVLQALEALAKPDPLLYGIPLVVAIPILEPDPACLQTNSNAHRLTINVYAHRMLFECMTAEAFRIVMASLNSDSISLAHPLVQSPANGPIVFEKDPETTVEILEQDENDDEEVSEEVGPQTRSSDVLDAFSTEGFLKLIENQGVHGVDTIYKHKIEPVLYAKNNPLLKVSLLSHQVHGVCWMYQMESLDDDGDDENASLGLNGLLWERRQFYEGDAYYYSPALGQARLAIGSSNGNRTRRRRRGGILADEMGLGKTVQALALVLATLEDLRNEANHRKKSTIAGKFHTHATLIIVPPALIGQWTNEIQKIAGENLSIQFIDHKDKNYQVAVDPNVDIVLTTYQTLETNAKKAPRAYKLSSTSWGRIILDEMQEVRSWNTTISKTCQELESDRRWMLSGTPLWEGIQDFKGELCFLGLEPFAANNEDGFFNFAIANHWKARSKHGLEILRILGLVMLRRTKSMSIIESGLPLLGLKKLTLVFEPVPQDPAERAMYCFLESIMHSVMEMADSTKTKQNKLIFLRLLRELCVSSYLLNGGLGCATQLGVLNRLMKEYNRLQLAKQDDSLPSAGKESNDRYYSCDGAIQFLSQVEDMARTDSDFVTDTRLGGGGGISRRNRALLINPQEEIDKASAKIAKSTEICQTARSSRAKARWKLALEGITSGRLQDKSCYEATAPSVLALWNWRNSVSCVKPTELLSFLKRGFRPTADYFGLSTSGHPLQREEKLAIIRERHGFDWAHPFAFTISNVPNQIDIATILISVGSVSIGTLRVGITTNDYIIKFSKQETFSSFERSVKRVDGVKLLIDENSPLIKDKIDAAKAKLDEAEAMFKVHPCEANERNLNKARSVYKKSKLGLRILDKKHCQSGQILCSRTFGDFRGIKPETSEVLFHTTAEQVAESTKNMAEHELTIREQEKRIKSMERKMKLDVAGTGIENLNTVDGLQALKNGEAEKTNCPICFDSLGESSNGKVALTRCGHMSCKSCLKQWMDQKKSEGMATSCIECRKPIRFDQLIFVDPQKVETEQLESRKKKAHDLVHQAAKMLEENYGQLEPHLWEALYLVIDLPNGIDRNHHNYYTAIPGLFLGHLRHAVGNSLPIACGANHKLSDSIMRVPLPSKFRALIADLPRDELSVVFASSKSIVLHLNRVLEREGFGCKTLFVGQSEKESESAVSDWESPSDDNNPATVLIVQAGAAACGLTLTAASKMFIIEPFRKHEEEKQAYARLHRYGQKNAVSCKVYYTPVSVESRLLEWRRRAKSHAPQEEKTVYAPLRHSNLKNDDDGTDDDVAIDLTSSNESIAEDENDQKQNSEAVWVYRPSTQIPPMKAVKVTLQK